METLVIKTLEFLKGQSIQVAIVFVGVLILTWLLQNKSAHVRYLLWLLVAIKCLTPPLVIFFVPVLPSEPLPVILPAQNAPVEHPQEPVIFEQPKSSETVTVPDKLQQSPLYPIENLSPRDRKPKIVNLVTSTGVLLSAWAAGAACYLVWALGKAVRLGMQLRRIRKPLPAHLMIEQIEKLTQLWNYPGGFKVWLVDGINQPFVWGLWRGAIYLPTRFQNIQGDKQKAIVLHEMAHVVRLDAFVNLIQILIQSVFWFHPLVWLANKAIRQEREKCCDEIAVARLGAAPKEYGSAIVDTLLQEAQAGLVIPTLAVAGPVKNIEDRIKTIMRPGRRFFHRPSTIALLVIGVLAAFVVPTTIALTQKVTPPNYTLSGTVVDAQTEKPIAGAIVFDDGYGPEPYQKGITDDSGKFEYKSWNEEHNIAAKADGYQPQTQVFTTFPLNNSKKLNFKLQSIPSDGVNANPQDENQPMDRTLYFKLPLAQPRFHWKFTNKDLYLSGRLVLRIIRDDQINEIVVFNKGEITEGWKAICSENGPQDNAIYFGFCSTTKYSTTPNDKIELELIVKEDLDGIGRLQTGVLKAGTHKAQGYLKIYSTDSDTAYIEWQDKWLLDITSEEGWMTSKQGFFINDNGTLRPLTRAEKKRIYAGTNWRNSSFMGNSDISLIENIAGKSGNESHFRKIRVRNDTLKKRVDITEFTDEKQEQVRSETTLVSERDSGGYLTQRFEHSQKKVFLENTDLNNDYNIFEFGRIDPKIAITIGILCYLFDDDNQVEQFENATVFSDTADVDQFQLINLKDNSILYTLELNKMDWGLCRKIQWYNKGGNTLSKSIEYANFNRPVEFKTLADPGDSGYLLPYKTVRRYFDNEGNEERTETLNIVDAAMVSNEKRDDYGVLQQNYGKDFDIETPHDYMIIDRRSQGGQEQSKVSGEMKITDPDSQLESLNSQFVASLPNGITVELLGICEHPSEGKQWWKPDGSVLGKSPYKKMQTSHINPQSGRKALEAAVKINGAKGIGFRYEIVGTQSSGSCGTGDQTIYAISFDQPESAERTDAHIGIAAGSWQTIASQEGDFSGVHSTNAVIWHSPAERNGKTILNIAHSLVDQNIRVVTVGRNGKEHTGGSTSSQKKGLESIQYNFDLPLSKIKEFQLQTRPYEWITFENVSLKPDQKTNVKIVTEAVDTTASQETENERSAVSDMHKVFLPEPSKAQQQKKGLLLDLASGQMLKIPESRPKNGGPAMFMDYFAKLNIGDLIYTKPNLVAARGGRARLQIGDKWLDFKKADADKTISTLELPFLPCTVEITTPENKVFQIQALREENDGLWIEYNKNADVKVETSSATVPALSAQEKERLAPPGRGALLFDGIDDILQIHASNSLGLDGPFTIQIWIKPEFPETSTPDKQRNLLVKGGYVLDAPGNDSNRQAQGHGFAVTLSPYKTEEMLVEPVIANGPIYGCGGFTEKYSGDWIPLVLKFNYDSAHYQPANNSDLIVGGQYLIPMGNHFKGQIGELRIWNRILTKDEIAYYKKNDVKGDEPGLAGCWTFEQNDGQKALDISINRNDARLGSTFREDKNDPTWISIEKEGEDIASPLRPGQKTEVKVEIPEELNSKI